METVNLQDMIEIRDNLWTKVVNGMTAISDPQMTEEERHTEWNSMWDKAYAKIRAKSPSDITGYVNPSLWGQHDAGWLSFYDFFQRACGLELSPALNPLCEIARSACWVWISDQVCILTERAHSLHRDSRDRLHMTNRMALEYPDGWGVYAWHGVRVPEQVILHPETLTTAQIEGEQNAEIRRVMLERFGMARYVKEAEFKVIDEDKDPLGFPRRLLSRDREGDEPIMLIELTNSTPEPDGQRNVYHLRVDPNLRPIRETEMGENQELNCLNAVASTFGMTGPDYALQVET